MRQRKIKDIDQKLSDFDDVIVPSSEGHSGSWRKLFENGTDKPLFLEIGSGKGRFITSSASQNPDVLFLAAEGLASVIIRGMVKSREMELDNIRFITTYINDMERDFAEGELDGIFMNFSDPWPKARHAKRRLTHKDRLLQYLKALKPGGFIRFKTHNDECKALASFDVTGLTRDLHASEFSKISPMTEYEEKFSSQGKNINYVSISKQ